MEEIDKLRIKIDAIDNELLLLIKKRLKLVKKVGLIKSKKSLKVKNLKREKEIFDHLFKTGKKIKLKKGIIKKIWTTLFEIAYKEEK